MLVQPTPELLDRLLRRAEAAASAGAPTFEVPELAPVAERLAERSPEARGWASRGAGYHDLVRLAARWALAAEPAGEPVYVPKAAAELEPLLALWPSVLALPLFAELSARDLIALRAHPVHVLGLVERTTWGDGRALPPAEYFFHDVDHARFKVREDLLTLGVPIPDAYQDGTTIDPGTGLHRAILPAAAGRVGPALRDRAADRLGLARRLLGTIASIGARALADAAELLLFEIVHEKGFPLDAPVLRRELGGDAHLAKIRRKRAAGFYRARDPGAEAAGALGEARRLLLEALWTSP